MSINYIDKNIDYNTLVGYVDIAVKNSFGSKSGKYHEYLQDYIETLCLISMFTDYEVKAKTMEDLVNEMLEICHSDEWKNVIIPKIGIKYEVFHDYVVTEIRNELRPFAKMDDLIDSTKKSMDILAQVLGSINIDKLKDISVEDVEEYLNNIKNAIDTLEQNELMGEGEEKKNVVNTPIEE